MQLFAIMRNAIVRVNQQFFPPKSIKTINELLLYAANPHHPVYRRLYDSLNIAGETWQMSVEFAERQIVEVLSSLCGENLAYCAKQFGEEVAALVEDELRLGDSRLRAWEAVPDQSARRAKLQLRFEPAAKRFDDSVATWEDSLDPPCRPLAGASVSALAWVHAFGGDAQILEKWRKSWDPFAAPSQPVRDELELLVANFLPCEEDD